MQYAANRYIIIDGGRVLPTLNLGDVVMVKVQFIPISRVTTGMEVTMKKWALREIGWNLNE